MALAMARGMNSMPGTHGWIAHEPLGEQRQKRDGAEQSHAIGGDGEQAGEEIAILEQRQIDDVAAGCSSRA